MIIQHLHIENLRVFKNLEFFPVPGINIITGSNGAGKTSLLESIYLLARAKSFRTNKSMNLIRSPKDQLIIRALLTRDDDSKENVGLLKNHSHTQINLSGKRIQSLSLLAKSIPLGILTANIHRLFEDGPRYRRKLLQWGVFHVEPYYAALIREFRKVLQQRNSALKQGQSHARVWDRQFTEKALQINDIHERYIDALNNIIISKLSDFKIFSNLKIEYKLGWNGLMSLEEQLKERIQQDQKLGYTSLGPQRCDIKLSVDRKAVKDVLSRGQQKMLGILLVTSQLEMVTNVTNERPILLIDDFPAELDLSSQNKLLSLFVNNNCQTILTSIETLRCEKTIAEKIGVFHVEHGKII